MRLSDVHAFRSLLLGKLSDDARISEDIKKLYEIFLNLFFILKRQWRHLEKIEKL